MSKLVPPALLSLVVLAATGCDMLRSPVMSADHAWTTYKARLNESCPQKHEDQLPQQKMNELAKAYYIAADTQAQQLIDLNTGRECKANGNRPACYNTGFVETLSQTGGLPEFVKTVCGQPAIGGPAEAAAKTE